MKTNKKIAAFGLVALSLIGFSFVNKTENNVYNPKASSQMAVLNVGDKAPELAYLNPEGKEMKLSDLKGKVVLIDFWASWCGPCRMENPNLVKAYGAYKDRKFKNGKGFEIFSVSLDNNKSKWIAAIDKDKLAWDGHVSDLKGWKAHGASLYSVNSIPAQFLIDGEGTIIAKNLRGPALENALKNLMVK